MNLLLNILKSVPLFEDLSEGEHKVIIEHIKMEFYPAHHKLFEKGQVGEAMYLIKSGMVRIHDGEKEIASLGDGDFFGEMALIDRAPRMAAAETLSDCELFVLKQEDFASLMATAPEIAKKVGDAYKARKTQNAYR